MGIGYDCAVQFILPSHQQLEHHEVGEQDVGLRGANSLAFFGTLLARVTGKGRFQMIWQSGLLDELVNFLALAVRQRIHRINYDCPRARRLALSAGADRSIDYRDKEAQ